MRNKYRIEGGKVFIQLDRKDGEVHEATVSLQSLNKLLMFDVKWSYYKKEGENTAYVSATLRGLKKTTVFLHRFILGASEGELVDHKNGNGLNNELNNIRIVSRAVNNANLHHLQKNNKTGVRGVYFEKHSGKYRVEFTKDRKKHRFGRYETIEEAKEKAEEAVKQLFPLEDRASHNGGRPQ